MVDLLCGPIKEYPTPKRQTQVTTEWIRVMPGGGRREYALSSGAHGTGGEFLLQSR